MTYGSCRTILQEPDSKSNDSFSYLLSTILLPLFEACLAEYEPKSLFALPSIPALLRVWYAKAYIHHVGDRSKFYRLVLCEISLHDELRNLGQCDFTILIMAKTNWSTSLFLLWQVLLKKNCSNLYVVCVSFCILFNRHLASVVHLHTLMAIIYL